MRTISNILLSAVLMTMAAAPAFSREIPGDQNKGWEDKVKAEKIAFITDAVGLTSEEAVVFWPVYNKCEAEKMQAFKAVNKAFKKMDEAIREGKSEKEISELLDKYIKAQQVRDGIDAKYINEYKKVLSDSKVAKLFIGEETFRREQIHRLRPKMPDRE